MRQGLVVVPDERRSPLRHPPEEREGLLGNHHVPRLRHLRRPLSLGITEPHDRRLPHRTPLPRRLEPDPAVCPPHQEGRTRRHLCVRLPRPGALRLPRRRAAKWPSPGGSTSRSRPLSSRRPASPPGDRGNRPPCSPTTALTRFLEVDLEPDLAPECHRLLAGGSAVDGTQTLHQRVGVARSGRLHRFLEKPLGKIGGHPPGFTIPLLSGDGAHASCYGTP